MTELGANRVTWWATRSFGVGGRLLLAFFAISAFAILAAAAGIYAFREVGDRLNLVHTRIAPTISSLELSRSAERIIAAAPALLAEGERRRRDQIKAELEAEVERLNRTLLALKSDATESSPLLKIEPIASSLTTKLAALEDLVARRLAINESIRRLQRDVFQTNDETQRLLAPWLEVISGEVSSLIEGVRTAEHRETDTSRLASLIELQRTTRSAQAKVSAGVDLLNQASTTQQSQRLPILTFQVHLTLRDLEATANSLDPKLRPQFLEQVTRLRVFAEGPNGIVEARKQELALIGEGEKLLGETRRVSTQLTTAVDELGGEAKREIGEAIRHALSVQQLSTRTLITLVGLSLLTSLLIVWVYVGGNIVRRLTKLSNGMLAIASGTLQVPVAAEGSDEIADMGRAVEVFRRNAIDLERLLKERKETAVRLESVVEERTRDLSEKNRQLEIADNYKSHFLASASHDLRQPLHALNLFVAQLRAESNPTQHDRIVANIDAAVSSLNELFGSLLDMAKLEAGVLEPSLANIPVRQILNRLQSTFDDAAREKGLRLTIVASDARVHSDFILLERILLNLLSNAVRYTARGGVVVGCRRRGNELRIDVCDTGPGIPPEQQGRIFGEYYRLDVIEGDQGGLGLGLAIVDRVGRLLGHKIELESLLGQGSRFSVYVPLMARCYAEVEALTPPAVLDPAHGKRVIVIDDDALVLEGMGGILHGWGCEVVAVNSAEAALAQIETHDGKPDLIISDVRLAHGKSGIEAIGRVRRAVGEATPAFLISGDTAPQLLQEASASGFQLLHKPVPPMRLRAVLNQALKPTSSAGPGAVREVRPTVSAAGDRAPPPQ